MTAERDLVLHGIAIKKHGTPEEIAGITGVALDTVREVIAAAVETGRALQAKGKVMLTPAAQMALNGGYANTYAPQRGDQTFLAAYHDFETINLDLKTVITNWQTLTVGGEQVANDHSDPAYDEDVIDALGKLHERAEAVLDRLAAGLPRLAIYRDKLLSALEQAEDGDTAWISSARTESYHTVWFELHEDLLRITGQQRSE